MLVALATLGRRAWCACGEWDVIAWSTTSAHNSQHLLDAYSFTHFQHGLVFWGAAALLGRSWPRFGVTAQLVAAVALEAGWEFVENTPMVIDRYRATTVSLGYVGDSVANSISDVACCALGWFVAHRLPVWATVVVFVAIEVTLLATVRDSLLLNVLMLLAPVEAVRRWQSG
jgi:hypothetical protein